MATTAQQIADLQRQNNEMYIQSAREQMAFQERMSNTAHQREVSDLIKSGLNPVLSATGGQGATTPNGAQADVDTQSMVSYLINEMNNENAAKMNSAQVAAQKYAADQALRAAQVAANAQIYAANQANQRNWPSILVEAFSDPNSKSAIAIKNFLNMLGFTVSTDTSSGGLGFNLPNGDQGSLSYTTENKILNWFRTQTDPSRSSGYLNGQAIPTWIRQHRGFLVELFKQLGSQRIASFLLSYSANSSAK